MDLAVIQRQVVKAIYSEAAERGSTVTMDSTQSGRAQGLFLKIAGRFTMAIEPHLLAWGMEPDSKPVDMPMMKRAKSQIRYREIPSVFVLRQKTKPTAFIRTTI